MLEGGGEGGGHLETASVYWASLCHVSPGPVTADTALSHVIPSPAPDMESSLSPSHNWRRTEFSSRH